MKEHTRNVIVLLCVIIIAQPWLIQNAYTNVDPEVYADFASASLLETQLFYYNTTGSYLYQTPVESFTANNTFTATGTMTAQDESEPTEIRMYWPAGAGESAKFNDSSFEAAADARITSILIQIYSDDDAIAGVLNMGFRTTHASDDFLFCQSVAYTIAASKAAAVPLRVYIPLTAYSTIELNSRFDMAPIRIGFVADAGGDMSQVFTVKVVFEKGADFATWESYLLWLGLLNFGIVIGMTKMYDMTPNRRSFRRKSRRGRRR